MAESKNENDTLSFYTVVCIKLISLRNIKDFNILWKVSNVNKCIDI